MTDIQIKRGIRIKRGLNIPIEGKITSQKVVPGDVSQEIGLNLSSFDDVKFRLLVDVGADVLIGQPLAEDKDTPGRMFVSPAAGKIQEIRRGLKRRLQAIRISVSSKEEDIAVTPKNLETTSKQELLSHLLQNGLFAHIRARPFGRLANPKTEPRSIFVRALESAPFVPDAALQIQGHEKAFQYGLDALKKLTSGPVHLVHQAGDAFSQFQHVQHHTASGPYPVSCQSVHIHFIEPIRKQSDLTWTVSTLDVLAIGSLLLTGKHHIARVVGVAGPAVLLEKRQLVQARFGTSLESLTKGRIDPKLSCRLISGDPLTGTRVESTDFLGFDHTVISAIPNPDTRQALHFFRAGKEKFSASGAYLSGHMNPDKHEFYFTTSQHGEERAFIDGSIYQNYMPMPILVMQLIRAIMSEDFELAESHGLLEITHEDFALSEFVDPSKIPMMDIVKSGLQQYAKDILG